MVRDTMDVLCACGHERRLHADGSGWCVRCDCERFETLLNERRQWRVQLDATRADLARTRAEAETLLATMGASTLRCLELEQQRDEARSEAAALLRSDRRIRDDLVLTSDDDVADAVHRLLLAYNAALAAPQSERPQPAAPVARSAEAADRCARLLIRLVRPMYAGPSGDQGLNDPLYGECIQAINAYKRSLATTPPDHQAGDDDASE